MIFINEIPDIKNILNEVLSEVKLIKDEKKIPLKPNNNIDSPVVCAGTVETVKTPLIQRNSIKVKDELFVFIIWNTANGCEVDIKYNGETISYHHPNYEMLIEEIKKEYSK